MRIEESSLVLFDIRKANFVVIVKLVIFYTTTYKKLSNMWRTKNYKHEKTNIDKLIKNGSNLLEQMGGKCVEIRETFANKCNSILSNNVHPPVSFPSRGRNLFLKLEYEMPLVLSVLGGWRFGGLGEEIYWRWRKHKKVPDLSWNVAVCPFAQIIFK